MGVKSKSVIALIATLALGVIIGALLVGPMIARHHFARVDALRTREGFAGKMERIIAPDASQVAQVRQVLTRHAAQFDGIFTQHRLEMDALIDSMYQELRPVLTVEQFERLQRERLGRGRGSRPGEMPPGPSSGGAPDGAPGPR